jgi:hypothetical protein
MPGLVTSTKIEHQAVFVITGNWRGQPLVSQMLYFQLLTDKGGEGGP